MLTIDLADFAFEIDDGAIKHVGSSTVAADVKLYDVEGIDVREFGAERVKVSFEAADGNAVEVALFPEALEALSAGLEGVDDATD